MVRRSNAPGALPRGVLSVAHRPLAMLGQEPTLSASVGALPTGTVTLLFSDVEASTRLLSRLGDDYTHVVSGQRAIQRAAWERWHGRELGTEGDSFFVVFSTAADAANAALEAQQALAAHEWPNGEQVRVRIGMHTGEPVAHEDGYVGMDVHRAARIAAAAHGGQTVVSETTRQLIVGRLPADARLADLGWHRLKDLQEAEHLHQLGAGSIDAFPVLKSLGRATGLPPEATPLVGRDGELRELTALLKLPEVRLVTLTGPGGSGKTRLATAAASRLAESFADGVYFVPLAAATTADQMWAAIVETLAMTGETRERTKFLHLVSQRRFLLVLDNLEQLVGAASVVDELLSAGAHLVVIATSRRPLHLQGEHEHPVPPLQLPSGADLAEAHLSGAVQLFAQQAKMVRPGFTLSSDNIEPVVAVCQRLDGLPLAIELAAARSKLLSPSALLARLDDTMGLRSQGVDRPARQQSLRNAIAWSYGLLSARQQATFRSLGALSGGGDLEAVAALGPDAVDPLDALAELVDFSLVVLGEGQRGEPRVRMLETVRDFALDQLVAEGEVEDVRRRHAEHFAQVAESLDPQLYTGQQLAARDVLEIEYDNFRHALDWTLRPGSAEPPTSEIARLGLRLASSLNYFSSSTGRGREARAWLERAIEIAPDPVSLPLARALNALALVQAEGSPEVLSALTRAVDMSRQLGDGYGLSEALSDLGATLATHGRTDEARAALQESIALAKTLDVKRPLSHALMALGFVEQDLGNAELAIELQRASGEACRDAGDLRGAALKSNNVACMLMDSGQIEEATDLLRGLCTDVLRLRDVATNFYFSATLAELSAELGHPALSARLIGTSHALGEQIGMRITHADEAMSERALVKARRMLPKERWDDEYASGRDDVPAEAIARAQQILFPELAEHSPEVSHDVPAP